MVIYVLETYLQKIKKLNKSLMFLTLFSSLFFCLKDKFKGVQLVPPPPICRQRVSAHKLLIELGRHNDIPRTYGICKICVFNQIKRVEHSSFLCEADAY